MSIAIAIVTAEGTAIGVDSLHTQTDGRSERFGMEKMVILHFNKSPAIVAFTGDGQIGKKLTADIIRALPDIDGSPKDIMNGIQTAIQNEYRRDIETFQWESESDKEEFLNEAFVVITCLLSPTTYSFVRIRPLSVDSVIFGAAPGVLCSGVSEIVEWLNALAPSSNLKEATSAVSHSLLHFCETSPSCGFPVKLIKWPLGAVPDELCINDSATLLRFRE